MLTLSEAITNRRVQDLSTNPLTYDHDDDANHTNAAKRLSSKDVMFGYYKRSASRSSLAALSGLPTSLFNIPRSLTSLYRFVSLCLVNQSLLVTQG
jgi:hypothetical protein